MKPGRNDPCPCSSGKTYKYCCLSGSATATDRRTDLAARTAAIDGYASDMVHFIAKCYGVDAIQQGWFEFTMGKSEAFVQGDPNVELFFSWLFHLWSPQKHKGNVISDATLYGVASCASNWANEIAASYDGFFGEPADEWYSGCGLGHAFLLRPYAARPHNSLGPIDMDAQGERR